MSIELPKLPYGLSDLEPYVSRETLDFHYNKHHQGYVNKLNDLINDATEAKGEFAHATLEDIVRASDGPIFQNAAQIWNHNFLWQSMTPRSTVPSQALSQALERDFGSLERFRDHFRQSALDHFGSGWVWLVEDGRGRLAVAATHDADTPLTRDDLKPLLTCDVWEHAYYIDRRNDRGAYLDAFWHVANWEHASRCLQP